MNANDRTRIYIPPKARGQLPWAYGDRKRMRGDRWVALLLLICSAIWGGFWWALR